MIEQLSVGKHGELMMGEAERRRWGLQPGGKMIAVETPHGLLLRPADPPLAKVYVEPTSRCNLNCRTCVRHSWQEPGGTMAMATYRRLVAGLRDIPTLRKVSFWGFGEPLLHPDIVEMVSLAKGLDAQTEIVTNGLLLDTAKSAALVEVGLDSIVFSVDGASPEAYADVRTGGELDALLENVSALRRAREGRPRHNPEIGIEFVATRSNLDQMAKLRSLALSMGASFIVVTNVLPYTREMCDEALYNMAVSMLPPRERSKWIPEVVMPTMDIRWHAAPIYALMEQWEDSAAVWRRGSVGGAYCKFVGEGAVGVGWDGGVSPCVAMMHTYTCFVLGREKSIKRCVLGNVGDAPIGAIWEGEEYKRLRARVQEFDFAPCTSCGGCNYAEANAEDCFGNTFPVCGDCLWARGVIQCP